jgi:hypothetical protein
VWPADRSGPAVAVLVWRPRPVVGVPRERAPQAELSRYVQEFSVAPFLRRLSPGASAGAEARAEYKRLLAKYGRDGDLPPGYTLVREHTRRR